MAVANPPIQAGNGRPKSSWRRVLNWCTQGGLAVMDYGLISGSNFVCAVLLARWMSADAYGAYAMGFSIYLLLLLLFQSVVLEPVSVFACSSYLNCRRAYVGTVKKLCIIGGLIAGALLGIAGLVTHLLGSGGGLPGALAGLAIATPALFYFWLTRRVFYVDLSPGPAAWGALFYVLILIGGLYLAHWRGHISPFIALLLMGVGGAATDLVLAGQMKRVLPPGGEGPSFREVLRQHWEYGRWSTSSAFASWSSTNFYYPLLSTFWGLAHAGELKALLNLTAPVSQTMASVSMLALPYAARAGRKRAGKLSARLTFLFIGTAAAYWVVVLPMQARVFHFLYPGGAYASVIKFVPLFAIMSALNSAFNGPAVMLRGLNFPRSVFVSRVLGAVISLAIGVPATWKYGLLGATIGLIVASLVTYAVGKLLVDRRLSEIKTAQASAAAQASELCA